MLTRNLLVALYLCPTQTPFVAFSSGIRSFTAAKETNMRNHARGSPHLGTQEIIENDNSGNTGGGHVGRGDHVNKTIGGIVAG